MIIYVNGEKMEADNAAVLSDVIKNHPYQTGSKIALIKSTESIRKGTNEFELITSRGPIGLRLNDTKYAALFRELVRDIQGKGIRWQTSKVLAIGSFPTQIEVSHEAVKYHKFECFFALGGFDSRSSYIMIAKLNHEGTYGATGAVLGKITRGRHILNELQEGEAILDIVPVVQEEAVRSGLVTDDLSHALEPEMGVETYVGVRLDKRSPVNSEHFLVIAEQGSMTMTERLETYSSCSSNLDVSLVAEAQAIREPGMVMVRHVGAGNGRIYFYKERRQISPSHSLIGQVTKGMELLRLAPSGSKLTIASEPGRIMTIGMTQGEGRRFLEALGRRQRRTGDEADDAIIVEQEPELTMEAFQEGEIETLGVRPERINDIAIDAAKAPQTARYVRKMTGLGHKPIGTLKVHFTFPEMPLITFDGNYGEAGSLVPENEFKEMCLRGDLAVTNMSRPNRGLIGIRLEPSDEFGPTGEERYGSNMFGKVTSDLGRLMENLNEGDIIYVREVKEVMVPAKKAVRRTKASKAEPKAESQPIAPDGSKAKGKRNKSKAKGEENGPAE
jgi:putative methanogenesis marker protein 3